MPKQNDIMISNRPITNRFFQRTGSLLLSLLLLSAADACANNLFVQLPLDRDRRNYATVAAGIPYTVRVYKYDHTIKGLNWGPGKIALPAGFKYDSKQAQVKLTDAKVDDPSLFDIVAREGSVITLQGKGTGETRLRVKSRGKLGNHLHGDVPVRTAVPNRVELIATCDDEKAKGRIPLQVAVNRDLHLVEELYSDKTPLSTTTFPEVDTGAMIPVEIRNGEPWRTAYLRTGHAIRVKTPAAATKTSLKVPAYSYELPVNIYEPSAISGIVLNARKTTCTECGRQPITIDILVNGEIPCHKPSLSLEVTVGPAEVCHRWEDVSKTKAAAANNTYQIPNPEPLYIVGSDPGICTVTVEAKGAGKSSSTEITVEKYIPPAKKTK